ncbi:MAG: AbrB/MazE/SpoVT family DNA-binding domain-containing protein [Nanoarchaeota archaeon]
MKPARRLQKTNKDQYLLTIPKTLIDLLNWKDKDDIEFSLDKGSITIKRRGK